MAALCVAIVTDVTVAPEGMYYRVHLLHADVGFESTFGPLPLGTTLTSQNRLNLIAQLKAEAQVAFGVTYSQNDTIQLLYPQEHIA